MEDWSAGNGSEVPNDGASLFSIADTRAPNQIILPPQLGQMDKRTVTNADYDVVPVFTMATLTTGRRASHGVIIAS